MPGEVKWTCDAVDAELDHALDTETHLSDPVRRHIATCGRCEAIYGAQEEAADLTAKLTPAVLKALGASLTPVRPLPSNGILTVRMVLVFTAVAMPMVSMMETAGFAVMKWWQSALMTAVLTGVCVLLAMSLVRQMMPGSLHRISVRTTVAILFAAFGTAVVCLFPWQMPDSFLRPGLHCLGAGSMMAIPAALLFGVLVWRGAPLGRGPLGATLGALAGLLAVTVLQFTCGLQEAMHLLVWHGSILAICALAGAWLGRNLEKVSA